MASNEHSRTDDDLASPGPTDDDAPSIRRIVVYGVLFVALLVVAWALIEGGDRDLWSPSAAHGLLPALMLPAP